MLQMQKQQISPKQLNKAFNLHQHTFDLAKVLIKSPKYIYSHCRTLSASIIVIPKIDIYNSPIEVDIKGFSCLHNFENIKSNRKNQFEMTESCLIEGDDKIEAILVDKVENVTNQPKTQALQNKSKFDGQNGQDGQYFLQGSLVLFQLDEENQQRLQSLIAQKRYEYPIQFTLPSNLPTSLQSLLLKTIHVSIKYTLEIKFSFCKVNDRKGQQQQVILTFAMLEQPKVYPFQQLVTTQEIRFYHQNGKKQDQFLKSCSTQLLRCLCPNSLLTYYISQNKMYSSVYQNYDLYHLQLLAAVSKDQSIYLTVRAYKDPELDQLTQNREKKNKDTKKVENTNIADIAPDISLASIKNTERKPPESNVQKVEVTMVGEIVNLCKQTIFQKTIYLTHSNYDMAQGQCFVHLKDYLQFTKSCHNQLFTLKYIFTIKAFFQQQENGEQSFETFVTKQQINELVL